MCDIIGLDVRNAFNTARWDKIMLALEDLSVPLYLGRVISRYLTDRTFLYDTDDGTNSYKITGVVPQGSELESPIWNIIYDGLVRQPLPHGVSIVAYADDIALIIVGKTIEDVQYLGDGNRGSKRLADRPWTQSCCRGSAHCQNKKRESKPLIRSTTRRSRRGTP